MVEGTDRGGLDWIIERREERSGLECMLWECLEPALPWLL